MSSKGKISAEKYSIKNRDRLNEQKRNHRLKVNYGITLEDYDKLYEKQNGVCAICSLPEVLMRLQVDHDHKTGKVRGLLCLYCNNILGKAKDSIETLEKAIEYLKGERV
ncbi:MAG TPA: hypothetical protein ENH85_09770 [Candidatus Scalindua sp.]|nr:hypothetical protein [Candidatus Scalindua sp.]